MEARLFWLRVLLGGLLYALIGLLFYVLWRSLELGPKRPFQTMLPARLVKLSGTTPIKQLYALRPVTALGRAPDNDIALDDPFVSAHHALILWRDGRWWIEDLGSQNGTWLNEEPVPRLASLTFGDLIRIGQTELFFEPDEASGNSERPGLSQELQQQL